MKSIYKRGCNKPVSIRTGNFLENIKVPLKQFILYLYLWSNFTSSENISKELGLCENTISTFNCKIRTLTSLIGGCNDIIEIDETVITKKTKEESFQPSGLLVEYLG
ncbi:unnamed protein product [Dracunculus medinensis]|uniref:HTH_Tnp_4 domain-containing protein n=1 Tax=Dracunculus medinensis TaxID=318479 RepID=A0A0N4U4U5_DRAME|nr:unnamed protein product [Dracunculus medinensis]